MSVFNSVLPVVTRLLGFGLQNLRDQLGGRAANRRAARELLAEEPTHLWTKGTEDGWIAFQVYLGKLESALRTAGVEASAVLEHLEAARQFWIAVEPSDDEDIGSYARSRRSRPANRMIS